MYGLLRRGGATAQDKLQVELDAVGAKLQVSQIALDKGAEVARAHVETTYADRLAKLDEDQKHEADKLRADPAALAAYLVRAGGPK